MVSTSHVSRTHMLLFPDDNGLYNNDYYLRLEEVRSLLTVMAAFRKLEKEERKKAAAAKKRESKKIEEGTKVTWACKLFRKKLSILFLAEISFPIWKVVSFVRGMVFIPFSFPTLLILRCRNGRTTCVKKISSRPVWINWPLL